MMYRNIWFSQSEPDLIDQIEESPTKVIKYLLENYDNVEETHDQPWGDSDDTYRWKNYVLAWNSHLDYVSLTEILE